MSNETEGQETLKPSDRKKVEPIRRGLIGNALAFVGHGLASLLTDLTCRGLENLPQEGPYLICVNHETFVDGLLVLKFLPKEHFNRTSVIAGADLADDYGLFGRVMLKYGQALLIDRLHGHSTASILAGVDLLNEGNILMIHPEGTRSENGHLGKIHSGASLIAKRANVPMVPVFIDGAYEVFSRHTKYPKFKDKDGKKKKIVVHFGAPIHPDNYRNTRMLSNALEQWMQEMFKHKVVPRYFGPDGYAIIDA